MFAKSWSEPFRSLVLEIPDETEVKSLLLQDWPPPKPVRGSGRVALLGDAFHPMVMCTATPSFPVYLGVTALTR